MAEIDYKNEMCWRIKEQLPIQCTKVRNRYGEWDIKIPKMSMSYDTFMKIESSIANMDAYNVSYDYIEGIAQMSVTKRGLEELEKMTEYVTILY
jgi:hypothetical protein